MTYESWGCTYQNSEQAAREAYASAQKAVDLQLAIQELMARLTSLLDEDQFSECERIAARAGVFPPSSPGVIAIANERLRQIAVEGWTPDRDAQYRDGSLTMAAICYAEWEHYEHPDGDDTDRIPINWPWSNDWWKPAGRRRNLEKAGALIAAELDQLIRKEATNG